MAVWSEVNISGLTRTGRLDPEYYQPLYIENLRFLQTHCAHPVVPLGTLLHSISGGATPRGADYPDEGVPFLRVQNIMPGYLDLSDVVYISKATHFGELERSRLLPGDVLLTITGVSYGKAAYVPLTLGEANINQHSVRMALNETVLPEYLATFLNCRFGRLQSDMKITGITRPALDYGEIRTFLIPVLSSEHQEEIRSTVQLSEQQRQDALDKYLEAEQVLLSELDIDMPNLSGQLSYEQQFIEVAAAGRYDAQYFHPEKRHILEELANLTGSPISASYSVVDEPFIPPTEDQGEEVQNYDLGEARRFFLEDKAAMSAFEVGSIKKRFQPGDVVVSRLRSYLKQIAVVKTSPASVTVASSEFIVLRANKAAISPEVLVVYLRSEPVQRILKWCQDGSNHPRFKEEELISIKLPERIVKIQDKIEGLVQGAIQAYSDAKQLLEDAKKRVEQIVLDGE